MKKNNLLMKKKNKEYFIVSNPQLQVNKSKMNPNPLVNNTTNSSNDSPDKTVTIPTIPSV